jgi:hypothetical protein
MKDRELQSQMLGGCLREEVLTREVRGGGDGSMSGLAVGYPDRFPYSVGGSIDERG